MEKIETFGEYHCALMDIAKEIDSYVKLRNAYVNVLTGNNKCVLSCEDKQGSVIFETHDVSSVVRDGMQKSLSDEMDSRLCKIRALIRRVSDYLDSTSYNQ